MNETISNQSELSVLLDSLTYGHENVISKNENYIVTKPLNTWDTNYRLYDKNEEVVYLVDCEDVQENEKYLNEYGGILYQDLLNLEIENIKDVSWKTEKEISN